MKGIDCTPEQLKAAEEFLRTVASVRAVDSAAPVMMTFGDLARALAWYGAMRYEAGKCGIGSLKKPASLVTRTKGAR